MRKIFLFLLAALLIGLAGIIFWLAHKPQQNIPPQSSEVASANQTPQNHVTNQPVQNGPIPLQMAASSKSVVPDAVMEYVRKIKADPQYDWKQPINFYGRVVDESNEPLAGATVNFEWNDISPTGTSKASTTSDGNGFFSLTGRRGKRLYVDVGKQGYYSSGDARNATFEYANPADGLFKPDPNNPVVFHLRKKGEGVNLIHGLKLFGSRIDGTLSYVDLTTSKNGLNPPGDLTVRFTRGERNADRKFDWTFTLGVIGGGLIESTDEFMFLAPEDGYQPEFSITNLISDSTWKSQEKRKFYVKSQDGQHYSRIEITIIPGYGKNAAYDLNWDLNPTGSRNLEPK